jgi:hypothetical protein
VQGAGSFQKHSRCSIRVERETNGSMMQEGGAMSDTWNAISAISSTAGAVITFGIAWMVQDYTKRKDKAAIIHEMWKQQQE